MTSQQNLEILMHSIDGHEYAIVDWEDFRIGYFLKKNISKDTNNEDSLFIYGEKECLIFGVSDGAGGHPRGKDASYIASSEIIDKFKNNSVRDVRVVEFIEGINDKILELKVGARSTFAMASISGEFARSYSVGDSEILYWNANGTLLYSNIPDTNVGHRIEAGMIEQKDSLEVPERHIVNNLLGDSNIRIEVASKMEVKKGHTVLVGSDGIFDNIPHETLSEVAGKGAFEKSFDDLVQLCIEQNAKHWMKDDDISFVMVRRIKAKE